MMKTKLTLFVTVLAAALFGVGCASTDNTAKRKHDFTDGLIAYYPFNGNAKDESGNGNDGEVKGATLTTDRNGDADKAYSFNGASHGISVSDSSSKLAPASLTASCWVSWGGKFRKHHGAALYKGNYNPFPNMAYSIEVDPEGSSGRLFGRSDSAKFGPAVSEGKNHLQSKSPMPVNEWVHCVLTINDSTKTAKLYINGVLNDFEVFPGTINQNAEVLSIGKYNFNNDFNLIGGVDDIRIYNRALSDDEVKALYDLEKSKSK